MMKCVKCKTMAKPKLLADRDHCNVPEVWGTMGYQSFSD